jgi:hypothetical protein
VLSDEDSLRLNVLMTQAEAVRLDPRAPAVLGLAGDRELRVTLHPQGRDDAYLLAVKRLLATLVIGHPGGFPVHISRWLRGGHLENLRVGDLLRLGEPEAVLAAATAPTLDGAVARRAWWARPEPVVARALLANPALDDAPLRRELAATLAEHLPFEDDDEALMETLTLIAAPGLLDDTVRERLWARGAERPAYRVGFLAAGAHDLPGGAAVHRRLATDGAALAAFAEQPLAVLLLRLLAPSGQAFLLACDDVLGEPGHREIVSRLLNLLGEECALEGFSEALQLDTIEAVMARVDAACAARDGAPGALLEALPAWREELRAALLLGAANESLCYALFARSTATGTLLRDKLGGVLQPLRAAIGVLVERPVPAPGRRRPRRRVSPTG